MGERDRQGQACEAGCLPRHEGQDYERAEEDRPDEEQGGEDRKPEAERQRQEGLLLYQGLDCGRGEGTEGARREGVRRGEEGDSAVQEGEGVLRPVSLMCLVQGDVALLR